MGGWIITIDHHKTGRRIYDSFICERCYHERPSKAAAGYMYSKYSTMNNVGCYRCWGRVAVTSTKDLILCLEY
jgi:ribosomal protein L40E